MAVRKFVSIASAGSSEDGYCLLAVADDGTAWVSDVVPSLGGMPLDQIQWHPVAAIPAKATKPMWSA